MARCCQAISCYLSQCWCRTMSPDCSTRPQSILYHRAEFLPHHDSYQWSKLKNYGPFAVNETNSAIWGNILEESWWYNISFLVSWWDILYIFLRFVMLPLQQLNWRVWAKTTFAKWFDGKMMIYGMLIVIIILCIFFSIFQPNEPDCVDKLVACIRQALPLFSVSREGVGLKFMLSWHKLDFADNIFRILKILSAKSKIIFFNENRMLTSFVAKDQ